MKESNELKEVVAAYLKAGAGGDFPFVAGRVSKSDGALFIGSGPDE